MTANAVDRANARSRADLPALPSQRALWPYGLFLFVAVVFCAPALAPGRILMPTSPSSFRPWLDDHTAAGEPSRSNDLMRDSLVLTLPGRIWNHESFSRGRLPLWNPHIFAGYPHLALIQDNALYPLSAAFDAIDPLSSLALSALLHFTLAGGLMYLFLRGLGLEPGAAAMGGVAFELNGMFLVQLSAPSYVYSGIWLPLLLLGARSIAAGRRRWIDLAVAFGAALSVLGGHPQITLLVLLLSGAYLLVEAWTAGASQGPARLRSVARAASVFALSVVLGVGLVGLQVVPFLELMANSSRDSVPLEAYRTTAMPLAGLLQAVRVIVDRLLYPESMERGWASVIAIMLFLGGVQLVSLGLIGQYVGRIFEESKKRPLYFVKERVGFPEPTGRDNRSPEDSKRGLD